MLKIKKKKNCPFTPEIAFFVSEWRKFAVFPLLYVQGLRMRAYEDPLKAPRLEYFAFWSATRKFNFNVQLNLPICAPWRHVGEAEVQLHSFLTSALPLYFRGPGVLDVLEKEKEICLLFVQRRSSCSLHCTDTVSVSTSSYTVMVYILCASCISVSLKLFSVEELVT